MPQTDETDGLEERMIQNLEDIIRKFCDFVMEYKDHEGYTHHWVILLPEVQLAYNTSVHSVTGKTPAILEKGWNALLKVDYLNKKLLSVHPTDKYFQKMWKKQCENAEKCTLKAKLYNKQRYVKFHKKPELKEGDQVLISTLKFNHLKFSKKMRDSFVAPFTIIRIIGKN
ncbi:hypothetical protein O181_000165 [Austropuccinia psidii MF-1]|uniref:Integrase catalytic domain-containing protein n=1 Tax=Austropuccinia psidii MF-1 TaxID=1389203 RepID=A0A9Q3GAL2_9BASI|nr:hypothetical protein [Austropuccinia psidii MF-1]